MKELGGLLLVFLSIIGYFAVATQMGLYQRWPIVHFLICLAGCAVLVVQVMKSERWRRLYAAVSLVLGLFLTGAFVWYTLDYSVYPSDDSPALDKDLGGELSGLELASHTGEAVPFLRGAGDRGTLVVFYRGHW